MVSGRPSPVQIPAAGLKYLPFSNVYSAWQRTTQKPQKAGGMEEMVGQGWPTVCGSRTDYWLTTPSWWSRRGRERQKKKNNNCWSKNDPWLFIYEVRWEHREKTTNSGSAVWVKTAPTPVKCSFWVRTVERDASLTIYWFRPTHRPKAPQSRPQRTLAKAAVLASSAYWAAAGFWRRRDCWLQHLHNQIRGHDKVMSGKIQTDREAPGCKGEYRTVCWRSTERLRMWDS